MRSLSGAFTRAQYEKMGQNICTMNNLIISIQFHYAATAEKVSAFLALRHGRVRAK